MPFLVDEDYALKLKLEGSPNFFVSNYADGKQLPIKVFFRSPDAEIVQRTFPHISIDLADTEPDYERMHRSASFIVPYDLEQATPAQGFNLVADDFPLPWMLIYQLSAITRDPWHDRQMGQLLYRMFPYQYGSLDMTNFDHTVRRADLRSTTRRDMPNDGNNKRIYRQIFEIGVSSEFYLNQIQMIQQVTSTKTTVEELRTGSS